MKPLSILRDTLFFVSRHFAALLVLCLPWIILESLAEQQVIRYYGDDHGLQWDLLVALMFYPLYAVALIRFMDQRNQGLRPAIRPLWTEAILLWPRFALLVAVATLLIGIGLWLLVIPGIVIMVRLAFAEYLLVLRGDSVATALRESVRLTRGLFLPLLACLAASLAPMLLMQVGVVDNLRERTATLDIILSSVGGFLQLLPMIAIYRLFMLGPGRKLELPLSTQNAHNEER